MRPPSSFKQDFLKKWMVGLQFYSTSSKEMSILKKKCAIKLSADVAMASAREGKTFWSRWLISKASREQDNMSKNLVRNILGDVEYERLITKPTSVHVSHHHNKGVRSKKILRKSCAMRRMRRHARHTRHEHKEARSIAKRLVKKRTQVLKGLVPGGESMDEFALLEETIDYLLSLQAQVDVMHKLVRASEVPDQK